MEKFIQARAEIVDNIKKITIGPGSENISNDIGNEIISKNPISRYISGILFPKNIKHINELENERFYDGYDEDDDVTDDKSGIDNHSLNQVQDITDDNDNLNYSYDDYSDNDKVDMMNELLRSAMGITFYTQEQLNNINISIDSAVYRKARYEDFDVNIDSSLKDYFNFCELQDLICISEGKLKFANAISYDKFNEKIDVFVRHLEENNFEKEIINSLKYPLKRLNSLNRSSYKRYPLKKELHIDLSGLKNNKKTLTTIVKFECNDVKEDLELELFIKKHDLNDGTFTYTIVLSNTNKIAPYSNEGIYRKCFFQTTMKIDTFNNPDLKFIELKQNPNQNFETLKQEDKSLELLYRFKKEYAIGHGISIDADIDDFGKGYIATTYFPTKEVPKLDFNIEELKEIDFILDMKNLSEYSRFTKDEMIEYLYEFSNAYLKWIDNNELEIANLPSKFKDIAHTHLNECKITFKRIRQGIDTLRDNEDTYKAFLLANTAMYIQRVHSNVSQKNQGDAIPDIANYDYKVEDYFSDSNNFKFSWRPFQLAFILMNIESMTNPNCEFRDVVDILWVSTGGGKTEAYLGLSAFTIFHRRIKYKDYGDGTSVIMRYTLRLLTSQQFSRASTLICACELLRNENEDLLGKKEISLGLWIGSGQTPNTLDDAQKKLQELEHGRSKENPFVVLTCPWCGTSLSKDNNNPRLGYRHEGVRNNKEFYIKCTSHDCKFSERLPIQVVDEMLYKEPPTFLIGTVDKFAMIPWIEECSSLFGKDKLAPELIIQDELHLISGPLGSIVGIYETIVDLLCSKNGVKPKIITATATIRNSYEQCKQLFARESKQFPPPGLKIEDSFFTREDNKNFGRLYVGIMPYGKTLLHAQSTLIATMLSSVASNHSDDNILNQYWTLLAYFNSLKEIGSANFQISESIRNEVKYITGKLKPGVYIKRPIYKVEELTSRKKSGDINKILKNIEIDYSKDNIENKMYATDIILASNMISVGLDVSRLNSMLLVQQPKTTSEYIQASSRIGRTYPGFAITLYNPSRSRDVSCFEKFINYHNAFYKYVEPTSVTSFSEPVVDRALHAVIVSLIRHSDERYQNDAYCINALESELAETKKNILDRVMYITNNPDECRYVEDAFDRFVRAWSRMASKDYLEDNKFRYGKVGKSRNSDSVDLLTTFDNKDNSDSIPTLTSMRNVSPSLGIHILKEEENIIYE